MINAEVTIIGGGIQGCAAAYFLAKAGCKVLLLEKDYVARHASGVNAGGVRRLGRHYAEVPLSVESIKIWNQFHHLLDLDTGFHSSFQMKLIANEEEMKKAKERIAYLNKLGFTHEEIIDDSKHIRQLVPNLSDLFCGAIYVKGDGSAIPYKTTLALKNQAEKAGAVFMEGVRSHKISRQKNIWHIQNELYENIETEKLIICAGAWASAFTQQVGENVPLQARAPMLSITNPLPDLFEGVLGIAGGKLSFKQFKNGTCLIGGGYLGTVCPTSNRTTLNYSNLARNYQLANHVIPKIKHANIVRSWAGIEGFMPDDIPVIGPSLTEENLYYAFGFSAHGFQLGPIVGKILCDLAISSKTSLAITPFSIGRFTKNS